ncbi:hypothetical protein HIM_03819 [Hirsutella minnesotensis 3608]|uniref:Extracelular serine carboxypeptidase n=1 Tax=Hirsutella minnesotensis 3608 TaxID=1043627 RepID=A0A0F8A2C8_9HYPO|nr:hypothetical protein HIM_03819 [Hirsutella minnesotensis 3608]
MLRDWIPKALAAACFIRGQVAAIRPIGAWYNLRAESDAVKWPRPASVQAAGSERSPLFQAHNLSVPVDHFHNDSRYEPHSDDFFNLRYWLDTSNYKEGGPVIVLHSGETSGENRLSYLEYGIVNILARATNGIGVILEHRYYGTSIPVANATVENYRFLSTVQTLADNAYFARNVKFPGLENVNLTGTEAPWIIYGGSYAGSVAAFTRKLYPELYWGAISSSGVPEAIDDYWQYLEAARHFAPGDCSIATQQVTDVVDSMLLSKNRTQADEIKDLFGLKELWDDDFASTISRGIMGLQDTQWDPEEDSSSFGTYCAVVGAKSPLFASVGHLRPAVERAVANANYNGHEASLLTTRMLNYVGYVKQHTRRERAERCKDQSIWDCFSVRSSGEDEDTSARWFRSWLYQTCTEWGYYITGSGVPKDQLPLISRAITLNYASIQCQRMFNITTRPDVAIVNKLGGYNLSYPRLAFIAGAQDPWRQASPHAIGRAERKSTVSEPFILIDPGVHHWDENGVKEEALSKQGLPPKQVAATQQAEIEFVKAWIAEWNDERHGKAGNMKLSGPELR